MTPLDKSNITTSMEFITLDNHKNNYLFASSALEGTLMKTELYKNI